MTIRAFKTQTTNKSLTMRYRSVATSLKATKRAQAVKEFRFFQAANANRRLLSRIA